MGSGVKGEGGYPWELGDMPSGSQLGKGQCLGQNLLLVATALFAQGALEGSLGVPSPPDCAPPSDPQLLSALRDVPCVCTGG